MKAGSSDPRVSYELLEEALRRRLARIDEVLEDLRRQGLNPDAVLDSVHLDPEVASLWRTIDSNILERSAEGNVDLDEALTWLDNLDRWTRAVIQRLRQSATKQSK